MRPLTTALVTGGGTGIGRACSLALHRAGHPVAISYRRSADDAGSVVDEITADGGRAVAVQADVTDDAAVRAMVAAAREQLGPIGVLVNNAGATIPMPLDDLDGATDDVWRQMLASTSWRPGTAPAPRSTTCAPPTTAASSTSARSPGSPARGPRCPTR